MTTAASTSPSRGELPQPRGSFTTRFVAPHAVVLDLDSRRTWLLRDGVAAVWLSLPSLASVGEVVSEVARLFGVPESDAAVVVDEAIDAMQRSGLLALPGASTDGPPAETGPRVLARPPEPCRRHTIGLAWAGSTTLSLSSLRVGVEYDSDETAAAIQASFPHWSDLDAPAVAPAFGVREGRLGLRRRPVAELYHGANLLHRVDSLAACLDALGEILADIERQDPGSLHVAARLFVRGGRGILVATEPGDFLETDAIVEAGIDEVAAWRPRIDPGTDTVTVGRRSWTLTGLVVRTRIERDDDELRTDLWRLGHGARERWAESIDRQPIGVARSEDDLATLLRERLNSNPLAGGPH